MEIRKYLNRYVYFYFFKYISNNQSGLQVRIRLFFCRKLGIHLSSRSRKIDLKFSASSMSLMKAVSYNYHSTYCQLCHKKLGSEPIDRNIFHEWPDDTVFKRNY